MTYAKLDGSSDDFREAADEGIIVKVEPVALKKIERKSKEKSMNFPLPSLKKTAICGIIYGSILS